MKHACVAAFLMFVLTICLGQTSPSLTKVRSKQCLDSLPTCQDFDAVVFVHGIYGDDDTFKNKTTGFDWPAEFPTCIEIGPDCRRIDVFRLDYKTALLSWAKGNKPGFKDVATAVFEVMKPLRKRQYRSIGFIAHSLGGNVVSTYIHMVKTEIGHPQRSQNAFVITLATPVLGSQIADFGAALKRELGMNDALLDSLTHNNLYLIMLNEFREEEIKKEGRYVCRPVHLHAAYEEKYIGPLLIVKPDSAATAISEIVDSPVIGFQLNHIEIARPSNAQAPVYLWAMGLVEKEYIRMATWEDAHRNASPENQLCERMSFIPER